MELAPRVERGSGKMKIGWFVWPEDEGIIKKYLRVGYEIRVTIGDNLRLHSNGHENL